MIELPPHPIDFEKLNLAEVEQKSAAGQASALLTQSFLLEGGYRRIAIDEKKLFEVCTHASASGDALGVARFALLKHFRVGGVSVKADCEKAINQVFPELDSAARAGHVYAQLFVGMLYHEGIGIKRDFRMGIASLRAAADQDEPMAQTQYGECLLYGRGIGPNRQNAMEWYVKAAQKGLAKAQSELGLIHGLGLGVKPDTHAAFEWWGRAAEQNYPPAMSMLADWYASIKIRATDAPDYEKAFEWNYKAALTGNINSSIALAEAYEKGQGTQRNRSEAYLIYSELLARDGLRPWTKKLYSNTLTSIEQRLRILKTSATRSPEGDGSFWMKWGDDAGDEIRETVRPSGSRPSPAGKHRPRR